MPDYSGVGSLADACAKCTGGEGITVARRRTGRQSIRMAGSQAGLGVLEVLISLALMGAIATVFISSLAVSTTSLVVVDERSTAESLARSHVEYVKNQPFSSAEWDYTINSGSRVTTAQPSWWDDDNPPLLPGGYSGYRIGANAQAVDIEGDGSDDEGVWKIEVTVYRDFDGSPLTILETHKVER